MSDIATSEPTEIVAGLSLSFKKTLDDYPASAGWSLSYILIHASATKITLATTASGDDHLVSKNAADTAAYVAGTYAMYGHVSKAGEKYRVFEGTVQVLANVETATTLDTRTHAKRTLDALEAMIEGRASSAQKSLSIGGRALSFMDPSELIEFRDYYRAEVKREENAEGIANGRKPKNRIKVRF